MDDTRVLPKAEFFMQNFFLALATFITTTLVSSGQPINLPQNAFPSGLSTYNESSDKLMPHPLPVAAVENSPVLSPVGNTTVVTVFPPKPVQVLPPPPPPNPIPDPKPQPVVEPPQPVPCYPIDPVPGKFKDPEDLVACPVPGPVPVSSGATHDETIQNHQPPLMPPTVGND